MGASMSSSFLYRLVAVVEIICSVVIAIFGVNTFLLFHEMNDKFQVDKEMILYSSIVAGVQSILTLFSTIFLIGCHHNILQKEIQSTQQFDPNNKPPKKVSQIGRHQHSLGRKAIAPTWIAWTLISISFLLFVFIAPLHYCIQDESDKEEFKEQQQQHSQEDGHYVTHESSSSQLGLCFSQSPYYIQMRRSLKDLYSFSIISILFKSLFVLMVYRNWRKELRRGKKVVIYVEGPESSANNDEFNESSISVDPKVAISSVSCPTGSSSMEGSELISPSTGENGSELIPTAIKDQK